MKFLLDVSPGHLASRRYTCASKQLGGTLPHSVCASFALVIRGSLNTHPCQTAPYQLSCSIRHAHIGGYGSFEIPEPRLCECGASETGNRILMVYERYEGHRHPRVYAERGFPLMWHLAARALLLFIH